MVDYNEIAVCETANEAFELLFNRLKTQTDYSSPEGSRDGPVAAELINCMTVIKDPSRGIITSKERKLPMRYALGELMWYLSGSNKTKDISVFSKKWKDLSDDGIHANSAYGDRIFYRYGFDQWEHVKSLLMKDPNTRQAVIHIKDASNTPTKDTPCTVSLQFLIREGKLHMTTYMRSNDIWFGFPYDVFSFTAMQIKMAFELEVDLGTYTHFAASLHLYERDLQTYNSQKARSDSPVLE